jgi:hypothetical protein
MITAEKINLNVRFSHFYSFILHLFVFNISDCIHFLSTSIVREHYFKVTAILYYLYFVYYS